MVSVYIFFAKSFNQNLSFPLSVKNIREQVRFMRSMVVKRASRCKTLKINFPGLTKLLHILNPDHSMFP